MKYKALTIAISSAVLSGCFATKIENPDKYQTVPMSKAAMFPTEAQLENRPYRVVVFNINDQAVPLAKQAIAGPAVADELARHIKKSNAVIVDKAGLEGLKRAIDTQKASFKNSAQVDYAVTGKISVGKYETKFHKTTYTKDKYGKVHVTEPSCSFNTLVQGNINIYDARSLRLAHTFAISGGELKSETLTKNHASYCRKLGKDEILSMIRASGISAAGREDVQLKNFFWPKGYVLERRMNGDENIFRISLGKTSGVSADQTAAFYSVVEDKNPVTGKVSYIQNKVGEGTVTDKLHDNHAWVIIKDSTVASQIKQGDIVKVVYEKSFMDSIFNRSYGK